VPPSWTILGAALLALSLHPVVYALQVFVARLYPIGEELASIGRLLEGGTGFWPLILVIAVLPAVCE